MDAIRKIYKVLRSVLFTSIVFVGALYLITYILISTPPVQNRIRIAAQEEVSRLIGSEIEIGSLSIRPFNEVVIEGLRVLTPQNRQILYVEKLGAGINIWRLVVSGRIELTYGEIIGLDASITQDYKGGPLNLQFLIDAFAPKDKNKPPTKFDLKLRNVVVRRSHFRFDRLWMPHAENSNQTDFNHLELSDFRADVALPQLSNENIDIDLRRLSFRLSGGLDLEKLAFQAQLRPTSLSVRNLIVSLPGSELRPSDIEVKFSSIKEIGDALMTEPHILSMVDNQITPSDFSWLSSKLRNFTGPATLSLDVEGSGSELTLSRFALDSEDGFNLEIKGSATNLSDIGNSSFSMDDVKLFLRKKLLDKIMEEVPGISGKARNILSNIGDITISATGKADISEKDYDMDCRLTTSCGSLFAVGSATGFTKASGNVDIEITTDDLNLSKLLGNSKISIVKGGIALNGRIISKDFDGEANMFVSEVVFDGSQYGGITANVVKDAENLLADVTVDNSLAEAKIQAEGVITGKSKKMDIRCDVERFVPSLLGILPQYDDYVFTGNMTAGIAGNNIDDVDGEIRLDNLRFGNRRKSISVKNMTLTSHNAGDERSIELRSDWVDGNVEGVFKVKEVTSIVKRIAAGVLPSLVGSYGVMSDEEKETPADIEFAFLVKPVNEAPEFFNLPFRFLVEIPIAGRIDGEGQCANLSVDIPYIQQGKNKLVRDSRLNLDIDGKAGVAGFELASIFPAKKGDLAVDLRMWSERENLYADLGFRNPDNDQFKGMLSLGAEIGRDELSSTPTVDVDVKPSIFDIGPARWNIDKGSIRYAAKELSVDNFRLWHDAQFVEIDGKASALMSDSLTVRLADINLDYIFDLLKINYVTFGGTATGEVVGKGLLGNSREARTDNLMVEDLSYNGAVLGDGHLKSFWNGEEKEVVIQADILDKALRRRASIDGGIWVTRDSLSFAMEADKIKIGFLKPFMSAFSSDVTGMASGKAKLYGTFSDIDLVGRLFADSIAMKLDFTNTWYHGSDSVILNPGHIEIPSFRLYDVKGNSAILTGNLTHRYFHEPRFNFRISDARSLLCYDTNSRMNPDWYGTIYGNGGAVVSGWPGTVAIAVDMDIVGNSTFTFVLNDMQAAEDYHFLTFSDRRKEQAERERRDSVPDVLAAFRKQIETQNSTPSNFSIDIRASVSPSALMTLVMDPVAGDWITARGNGAIQMEYESDTEELSMFGKYTLEEGNYNFSLQDLILKDFSIRPGSTISFNGDPMNANLDITASYRVNTNLSDLDKSFSTDRDLARTNVPVDALLMVNGEMQHPDITFDIELPTLTQDVERKVKSIVSTDDMMSRQIIYLLALNRFYTPEYMGASGNGGELAAVASTTLSSQLSNMLGQLTDKFSLAPSFRSDKGDFSDIEVDVALSSRLLNNRLLVNGNFGYRDRSTSTTTFVGDFDIEYLLNAKGDLRLKAYNHFNDQNYYLREALTTQGIGVVYRRDFDNPFSFLKRKRKKKGPGTHSGTGMSDESVEKSDSVKAE